MKYFIFIVLSIISFECVYSKECFQYIVSHGNESQCLQWKRFLDCMSEQSESQGFNMDSLLELCEKDCGELCKYNKKTVNNLDELNENIAAIGIITLTTLIIVLGLSFCVCCVSIVELFTLNKRIQNLLDKKNK